jgi:transcriptional regulator with GAF, ATPase, and Fis domain
MNDRMNGLVDTGKDAGLIQQRLIRNWYLLAAVSIASTTGLIVALAPTVSARLTDVWPWANTNVVLLGGLAACVGLLIAHLTIQQRKVLGIGEHIRRMDEEAQHRSRQQHTRLHALLNVSRMMGAMAEPDNMFRGITETCLEILPCDRASLMILDEPSQTLEVRAASGGADSRRIEGETQAVGQGIAGWVAENRRPLILDAETDMAEYPGLQLKAPHLTAAMVVPIITRAELVGVLNVSSGTETEYSRDDLDALQVFAENAGTCIRFSQRATWMRQMIEKSAERTAAREDSPAGA